MSQIDLLVSKIDALFLYIDSLLSWHLVSQINDLVSHISVLGTEIERISF